LEQAQRQHAWRIGRSRGIPRDRHHEVKGDAMKDIVVKTTGGNRAQISAEILTPFRGGLRGTLALPAEEGYEEARTLWNAMIDRRPAAVVRAKTAEDIAETVKLAARHDLLLAVRGGGHNIAGNAACDGGLMLDLSLMK